jgi:hypothetical protein
MRKNVSSPVKLIWQLSLVFGCLLAVTLVMVACSSTSGNLSGSGMGKVSVSISDPATCQAPSGPFSHVYVTITDVQANVSSSSNSGWVDLTPKLSPTQVDLLGIANNQCFLATLGDPLELQAGSYQQIRIMLASNTAAGASGNKCGSANNCVVLSDSSSHTLQLSSEAQTGIKIPSGQIAGGAFNIAAGQTKDLDIDFNTCSSIVTEGSAAQGNVQYLLKPVLHAGEASTTSVSLNGKVVDAAGNPVAGAFVSLEQPDPNGAKDGNGNPIDRFIVGTTTDANGAWDICPLTVQLDGDPSKPYDIVVTGSNSSGVLFAPSIVTGISMGSTTGTVTLHASATLNTSALSTATITGQVTSSSTSNTPQAIDFSLSVLETVNKVDYTILLPATGEPNFMASTAATANGTEPCPNNADCYDYSLSTEANGAYIGTWSSGGATLAQPNVVPAYVIDGFATETGTSTTTCNPTEVFSPVTFTAASLTTPPLAGSADLSFTSCQ